MADKRKLPDGPAIEELASSEDELSEKNLRKRLRQAPFLEIDSSQEKDDGEIQTDAAPTVQSTDSGRPRRSTREASKVLTEPPKVLTELPPPRRAGLRTKAPPAQVALDYDTFLQQNGIEEKPRGMGRRPARPKVAKRSYSSESFESNSDSSIASVKPKRGQTKRQRKPPAKTSAAKPTRSKTKTKKNDSDSSDSDDYEVPQKDPPKRQLTKKNDSSDDSSQDGGSAFKKRRGKKKKKDDSSSDEFAEFRISGADNTLSNEEDEGFIIDKILARETHTPLEWKKKCHSMQTHYVTNGSIFVEDDEIDGAVTDKKAKANNEDKDKPSEDVAKPTTDDDNEERVDGIEKFLVKWRNLSYLHVTWETEAALIDYEKNAKGKIQRFLDREAIQMLSDDMQGDEYFNPEFCTVDRILNIQPSEVPNVGKPGFQMEYYVKWKALSYDECTWEQEIDVHDDAAVATYHAFNKEPPPSAKSVSGSKRKTSKFIPYNEHNPIEFKNKMELRDYQLTGVNWMIFNWYNNRNSLLADEMGLGKTVQTVAYINHLVTKERLRGPYLIIAPLSTLSHWQREFTSWTNLNAVIFHGSQEARKIIESYEFYRNSKKGGKANNYRFDVIITTFEMCTANDYLTLARIKWQLAVVDEAHRLKNKKSKLSQVLEERFHYENLLLLTGTPLQNNVEELWTLLHFLDPVKFDSADNFISLFGDLKDSSQVERLHSELKPFLLRRMKEDVEKSLAPKEETIIEVELTVLQKQYYRAIYERNSEFLSRGNKKAHAPSLMNIVMELRKCCNHPFLIQGVEERELHRIQKEQPKDLVGSKRQEAVHQQLNDLLVTSCGKLVLLDKLLPRLREGGHRVLIFSQFKIMLNILEDYLRMRGYPRERIDGSITGNDRQAAIDRFCDPQSSSFIMLLSTRAGGVGINLTAADTCIIYDSDWNPQNDLQAQARCHRIGQTKSVKVYRLLTSKTYELHMFHQASLKLGLDQAVLGGIRQVKSSTKGPSKEEIESLLKHGAYEMFKEEKEGDAEAASKKFSEESVDEILSRSTTVIHDPKKQEKNLFSSSFSKATFVSSTNPDEQVALDDPDFWIKVIGLTGMPEEEKKNKTPEKRRCRGRKVYTEVGSDDDRNPDKDGEYKFEEISSSTSDEEDATPEVKTTYSNVHKFHQNFVTALLTYGFGRWTKIRMSDPILNKFSILKIKEYALGFLVQMLRVACMDNIKEGIDQAASNSAATIQAMNKMAIKYKFVVYWLQVVYREKNPTSQFRELYDLHQIPVQEELQRLNVVASLSKSAGKYLQQLEVLFVLDQFIMRRLSPMIEVLSVLHEPFRSNTDGDVNMSSQSVVRKLDLDSEHSKTDGTNDSTANPSSTDEPKTDAETKPSILDEAKRSPDVDSKPTTAQEELKPTAKMEVEPTTSVDTKLATDVEPKSTTEVDSKPNPDVQSKPSVENAVPKTNGEATQASPSSDKSTGMNSPPRPKPEILAKWKQNIETLPPLPGIAIASWWSSPQDDVRLLFIVHRYGWLKGSKQQFQQIRTDKLFFPHGHPGRLESSTWPSLAVLNKRLKAIIRNWADKAVPMSWPPTKAPPPPAPQRQEIRPANNKGIHSAVPQVSLQHAKSSQAFLQQMWERRGRFMGLIMSHGIPDIRLCANAAEEREKWRYFHFDNVLRAKHLTPQDLYAEAMSLEQACRFAVAKVKPPITTERSAFGAFRFDWVLTFDQAQALLHRIELFRMLRLKVLILRPADLHATMNLVAEQGFYRKLTPVWWRSPEFDILLMQGVECYGLDNHIHEMWSLFHSYTPVRNFPNVAWVDSTVTACATAVVQARYGPEITPNEQAAVKVLAEAGTPKPEPVKPPIVENIQREQLLMALEDPHVNKKAFMWYMLQKKEAELNRPSIDQLKQRAKRDLVQQQIEQERQMRKRELESKQKAAAVAASAVPRVLPPVTRRPEPEVIEIDDSD
ncbi:unnamed protein product [Aphanomyces euteiches]